MRCHSPQRLQAEESPGGIALRFDLVDASAEAAVRDLKMTFALVDRVFILGRP